ncbi:MAG TPA: hypothetical protein VF637_14130 [Sphingomicrobium sp.]
MSAHVGAPDAVLARTASILRTSTTTKPGVLRVLFYGQSITSPAWTDAAVAHLRRRYPNTAIIAKNLAIGGNSADLLERATERDIEDFFPDLIVFHVFGDHRAYERIIRLFRSRTAAEIIVQTDPVRLPVEPLCHEGLNLNGKTPEGCVGKYWLRQRIWEDFMSSDFIPKMAVKYRLDLDPRREGWNDYLHRHNLAPSQLLADGLHPNATGWKLAATLFQVYFDARISAWQGQPQKLVVSLHAPDAADTTYEVEGNRIELISDRPLVEAPHVQIDTMSSRVIDGCWQVSRVSSVPGIPEWPAIRQVFVDRSVHQSLQWVARVRSDDFSHHDFSFSVYNSRDGYDGNGSGADDFHSRHGGMAIKKEDWVFTYAIQKGRTEGLPRSFDVNWSMSFKCKQQAPIHLPNGKLQYRYLAAAGLSNEKHVLRMSINDKDRAKITEVRVYKPPLSSFG